MSHKKKKVVVVTETPSAEVNPYAQVAEALKQFQVALDAMKAAGLLTENLTLPMLAVQSAEARVAADKAAIDTFLGRKAAAEADVLDAYKAEHDASVEARVAADKAAIDTFLGRKAVAEAAVAAAPAKPKRIPAPDKVYDFLTWFITTDEANLYNVRRGQWECVTGVEAEGTSHRMLFHSKVTGSRNVAGNVICIRPLGCKDTLFNASRITYGNSWRDQRPPQVVAEAAGAIPVPFEVIKATGEGGAGLELDKLKLVAHDPAEQLLIPPLQNRFYTRFNVSQRHFAGAAVVRIEDDYFLFDTDREELKYFGFNPFFTRLPGPVKTVAEAVDSLMPDAVRYAIADGKAVKRQGEFFFVPVNNEDVEDLVLGHDASSRAHAYTYHSVLNKLLRLGLTQILDLHATSKRELEEFLSKSDSQVNGKILTANGESTGISARDITAKYMAELVSVLEFPHPMAAGYTHHDEHDFYTWRNTTVRPFVQGEVDSVVRALGHLLADGKDVYRYGAKPGPLASWNIRLDASLGVVDAKGNSRGRHTCTATFEHSPTEVYALGTVRHGGREHRPLFLGAHWHRVYGNSSSQNWTVQTGTAC